MRGRFPSGRPKRRQRWLSAEEAPADLRNGNEALQLCQHAVQAIACGLSGTQVSRSAVRIAMACRANAKHVSWRVSWPAANDRSGAEEIMRACPDERRLLTDRREAQANFEGCDHG